MATLTGQKINTTYDGLLKTEDNQPISTTKKRVTDGYGNQTGLSVDSLGNVDVSDDLNVLGNASVTGSTTANSFIKTGGTSTQFLKADGSIDGNTYITSESDTLDSVTDRGNSTTNSITVNGLTATTATVDSLEIQFGLRDQANSLGTNGQILTSTGTGTDWKSTSELGLIDGSGTTNRLPKFTDADTIGNSTITDTSTKIGVNNANPTYSIDVYRNEATNILRLQNNTFSSWFGSDTTGFSIETNLFKPIVFKPSGVTAMTLDSSGNVTVNNNLSIGGTLIDSNSSSGTSGQILSSTGTGTDWVSLSEISGVDGTGTANYISKWTDGDTIGNSVIYDNGTNVGIGTSSPNNNGGFTTLTINGLTNGGVLAFSQADARRGLIYTDSSTGDLITQSESLRNLRFNTSGANERMRIDSNGNIGINAIAENSLGTWRNYQFGSLSMAGRSNDLNPDAMFGTNFKFTTANAEQRISAHATSRLFFNDDIITFQNSGADSAGSNITWSERMRIDSSGKVGIGMPNPTTKLDVTDNNDTVYVSAGGDQWEGIRIVNTSPTEGDNKFAQLGFYVDGGTNVATGAIGLVQPDEDTRGGDLYFKTKNAGGTTAERMRITSGGDVELTNKIKAPLHTSYEGSFTSSSGNWVNVYLLEQSQLRNRTITASVYVNGTHSYASATIYVMYSGGPYVTSIQNIFGNSGANLRISGAYLQFYVSPWSALSFYRLTVN